MKISPHSKFFKLCLLVSTIIIRLSQVQGKGTLITCASQLSNFFTYTSEVPVKKTENSLPIPPCGRDEVSSKLLPQSSKV